MDRGRRGAPRNRVIGAAPPPGPNRVTAARGAAPCGHRVWGGTAAGWGLGEDWGARAGQGARSRSRTPCVCAHTPIHTHTHTHTHPGTRTAPALQAAPADQAAMGAPTGSVGHRSSTPLTDVPDATRALLALYRGTPRRPGSVDPPVPWGRRRGAALGGTPIRAPLCPPPRVPLWGEGHFHAVPCSGDRRFPPARSRFPSEGLLRPLPTAGPGPVPLPRCLPPSRPRIVWSVWS